MVRMNKRQEKLLALAAGNDLTKEEISEVRALVDESAEAARLLDEHEAVWRAVADQRAPSFGPYFADRVMKATRARPSVSSSGRVSPRLSLPLMRRLVSVAALAAALIVTIILWPESHPRLFEVPAGSMQTVTLDDGSTVEIAGGTRLEVLELEGGSARRVSLAGEAFFDVTRDERPFVVETFNAEIRVLGTRFNIRSWVDDPEFETIVSVVDGEVSVSGQDRPEELILVRGETAVVSGHEAPASVREARSIERITAWRRGGMAFVNRSLGSVLNDLGRRYGKRLVLRDSALRTEPVTYLQPNPGTLEQVLSDICFSKGLQFIPTLEGFEIKRPDSLQVRPDNPTR